MADQADGLFSPWLRSRRMGAVRPYLKGSVLDFGCGAGRLACLVQSENYVGFDPDTGSVKCARTCFPAYTFDTALPRGRKFDTIAALAVLEHLDNPESTLRELSDYLAPNGRIVLTTPHRAFEWVHTAGASVGAFSQHASEDHEKLYDRQTLMAIAEGAGFRMTYYRRFLLGANQVAVLQSFS
jgi:2-polyprenyl-3-methyl-5-hydroxy-6-metoxy-1,4-benzoquinol methylase